jgi:hypothetical protein
MTSNERRSGREQALKVFNTLASEHQLQLLSMRASTNAIEELYKQLCQRVTQEQVKRLSDAREAFCSNGGAVLDVALLPSHQQRGQDAPEDATGALEQHRTLVIKKNFRLRSKAFMLTFNSILFAASFETWCAFVAWIMKKVTEYKARFYSAAMESSLSSVMPGRVHLHVYFSWHSGIGIDHETTDGWCFDFKSSTIRPRVDVYSENRGPSYWIRAVQHGHFYVQVDKMGKIFWTSNYAAWEAGWVPEAQWVTSLWKKHKISTDTYLALSLQLRDQHDRRKVMAEVVMADTSQAAHQEESDLALFLIGRTAKPFKPLPDVVQEWRLQYAEALDRYKLLVLFGPSRTGKSRLGRALYADTLVVDVQHAEHPDLRGYIRGRDTAILLDEASSPQFIVDNKKLLQAHIDGAKLGQSSTQKFSYEIFLWRTPIIVTTNNYDYSKFSEADTNWIESNCMAVHVSTPVWQVSGSEPAPPLPFHYPSIKELATKVSVPRSNDVTIGHSTPQVPKMPRLGASDDPGLPS